VFRVAANDGAAVREGTIVINNEQARVAQRAPCRYVLTPASQTIATSGGASTVSVATDSDCAWTATTDSVWLSLTAPTTGTGAGVISFTVPPNPGSDRTGTITVAGQRATVVQSSAPIPCSVTISPTSQSFTAAGGAGQSIAVTSPNTCTWTAQSGVPWIAVTSGSTGSGNGTVTFNVAANTGAARTGTIGIANRTFTVSQAAAAAPPPACTYAIAPTSQNVDANANTGTVAVTADAGCTWTATSGVAWITVTAGATGSGNGSVGFSVAANTGAARSGTLTIAGQVFTVNQAAFVPPPCTYAIAPTSQNVPVLGASGTVNVTTAVGCTWTASSNAPWLTITSGASGSGNGAVGFTAAANVGAARSGTLTIAGQTFTVTQDAVVGPLSQQSQP
jgi:hypothetical protein